MRQQAVRTVSGKLRHSQIKMSAKCVEATYGPRTLLRYGARCLEHSEAAECRYPQVLSQVVRRPAR